ncbi:NAD(P)H-quinone oxidoreductase [Neolewinella agarilytica]|uniref:Putative NAD(P)H quinone oxidoreductase, PIG3 family n=1 Tax=Neolewinella agarilytica TaxID=478744 RepID=A0A1H9NR76_9BACT|nr:NAD(P)H-quinone oxidoreductase [Neolewinella agarilytica]SER38480.1 putative NAD(P)H quinone oxidoreductase, PIG3 family [Neolewinella agarilytica]
MKAIHHNSPARGQYQILEIADPTPGPTEVLLHVTATSLNRADLMQVAGHYPAPKGASELLGLDVAGTVIGLGSAVTDFEVGDNVCALVQGGGYAQQICVDEMMLLRLPERLSFTKAAAVPETFLTAFQALHWIADLQEGMTVLIHAGGSGVGTAAIQLCRLAGATPIVTASPMKHARLKDLGAEICIDYRSQKFDEVVLAKTDGKGADIILDFVGGPYLEQNLHAVAMDGTIVCLGLLGGAGVEHLNMVRIVTKRVTISGTTLRSRSDDYRAALTADFRDRIWPSFADRTLQPVVDTIYDWEQVDEAHAYMAANANVGKIVLTIGE